MKFDEKKLEKILARNVEDVIKREELEKKLTSGKQLRIKHGVDVTSPLLHLGHAVDYWKMREFQELGHKVVFLIGDFTTQIGDPTGKSKTRPEIEEATIKENAQTYLDQVKKILIDTPELLEVRRNSEWYGDMKISDFLGLLKLVTHAQLIERDMFQERIKQDQDIYVHELLYPILQGYDSVMLESDLTVIGSDQLFNEMMGRRFQKAFGQDPQVVMTTTITPGLDGKEKMSKSLGNFIALLDAPQDKFGKIMSMPDSLIDSYLFVYTQLPMEEVQHVVELHPREKKERLAYEIVKLYHGEKEADQARKFFESVFQKKSIPEDMQATQVMSGMEWGTFLVDTGYAKSKSEAKRLIEGGGVDFNEARITLASDKITKGGIAKIGKHTFVKIEIK